MCELPKMVKILPAFLIIFCLVGLTNAVLITDEDFEAGATGWNNNTTSNGGNPFSTFLGNFNGAGGTQQLFKSYTLSGKQTQATIEFDFYEIDSWDYEYFNVFVDDGQIIHDQFKHNREDFANSPSMSASSLLFPNDNGNINYGYAGWPDQGYHYVYTFNTTATSVKLGFGATISSGIGDESFGIDNVIITTDYIPEPTTLILLGMGIIGIARKRHI